MTSAVSGRAIETRFNVEGAVEQDRLVRQDMELFHRGWGRRIRRRLGVRGYAAEESKAEQANRVDEP